MTRHVFETMGTVVSVAGAELDERTMREIEAVFDRWDRRFSLYDPTSEASRIARSELRLTASSAPMIDAYAQALDWRSRTSDLFTPHRPDGVVDLSGIVKALAIDEGGRVLDASGCAWWSLNCGGDGLMRASESVVSTVGIVDPAARERLIAVVELAGSRRAVATSGSSERGDHIWGPRLDLVQVSVVADDIVTADVLATALVAGGRDSLDAIARAEDCDVLAVTGDGMLLATPGIRLAGAQREGVGAVSP